jgi:hypothetical protein
MFSCQRLERAVLALKRAETRAVLDSLAPRGGEHQGEGSKGKRHRRAQEMRLDFILGLRYRKQQHDLMADGDA